VNLTHLDEQNKPKMVDVGDKAATTRIATASGIIEVGQPAFDAVIANTAKKGPVLQTAVIAAIQGTKQTSTLIPMCHPLMLTSVKTDIEELPELPGFKLTITAKLNGQTACYKSVSDVQSTLKERRPSDDSWTQSRHVRADALNITTGPHARKY